MWCIVKTRQHATAIALGVALLVIHAPSSPSGRWWLTVLPSAVIESQVSEAKGLAEEEGLASPVAWFDALISSLYLPQSCWVGELRFLVGGFSTANLPCHPHRGPPSWVG